MEKRVYEIPELLLITLPYCHGAIDSCKTVEAMCDDEDQGGDQPCGEDDSGEVG